VHPVTPSYSPIQALLSLVAHALGHPGPCSGSPVRDPVVDRYRPGATSIGTLLGGRAGRGRVYVVARPHYPTVNELVHEYRDLSTGAREGASDFDLELLLGCVD
jgi:hypothetical protein